MPELRTTTRQALVEALLRIPGSATQAVQAQLTGGWPEQVRSNLTWTGAPRADLLALVVRAARESPTGGDRTPLGLLLDNALTLAAGSEAAHPLREMRENLHAGLSWQEPPPAFRRPSARPVAPADQPQRHADIANAFQAGDYDRMEVLAAGLPPDRRGLAPLLQQGRTVRRQITAPANALVTAWIEQRWADVVRLADRMPALPAQVQPLIDQARQAQGLRPRRPRTLRFSPFLLLMGVMMVVGGLGLLFALLYPGAADAGAPIPVRLAKYGAPWIGMSLGFFLLSRFGPPRAAVDAVLPPPPAGGPPALRQLLLLALGAAGGTLIGWVGLAFAALVLMLQTPGIIGMVIFGVVFSALAVVALAPPWLAIARTLRLAPAAGSVPRLPVYHDPAYVSLLRLVLGALPMTAILLLVLSPIPYVVFSDPTALAPLVLVGWLLAVGAGVGLLWLLRQIGNYVAGRRAQAREMEQARVARLVEMLAAAPIFAAPAVRELLLLDLPAALAAAIPRAPEARADLAAMMTQAAAWGALDDGTPALAVVLENARDLAPATPLAPLLDEVRATTPVEPDYPARFQQVIAAGARGDWATVPVVGAALPPDYPGLAPLLQCASAAGGGPGGGMEVTR
jgi:hypothetical protein